jgi:hypothetical protein
LAIFAQAMSRTSPTTASVGEAGGGRAQGERSLQVLPLAVRVPILGKRGAIGFRRKRFHALFCFPRRLAWLKPAQNSQPPPASRIQRAAVGVQYRFAPDGNGDVVAAIQIQAGKPRRGHADDGEGMPVQPDGLPEYVGISAETPLPEAVADDCHRSGVPAAVDIVILGDQASAHRWHA